MNGAWTFLDPRRLGLLLALVAALTATPLGVAVAVTVLAGLALSRAVRPRDVARTGRPLPRDA